MILIDIETPEKCGSCPCFHAENPMYCQAVKADKNKKIVAPYGLPRPDWCPLKEQEAVEARKKSNGIPQPWASWWYVCGDCGQEIEYHDRFCRWCGRAAKWE